MKCQATILVEGDPDKLQQCLQPELVDYARSSSKIAKTDTGLQFDIAAKDAVALRATMNAITQSLAIYEKIAKKEI